uniref:Uncharacterized protein n=1 Tax=Marseillevirus LCMAC101 TaxID=2506602 RepID=A0A481YRX9_9VIRU|nr:MAG: hypothetical protein LCMAC101_03840 [Marseillevirus LCMAC101]
MEDIQSDSPIKVQDVDSLTQKMSKTSISQKSASFMGPLRPKYKRPSDKISKKARRMVLLRIIDGHTYAIIIGTSENLEALDLGC